MTHCRDRSMCQRKMRDVYENVPKECLSIFFNIDVEKRGIDRLVFRNDSLRVLVRSNDEGIVIDTIINKHAYNDLKDIGSVNENEIRAVARCVSKINVLRIRGILVNENCKVVEFKLNDNMFLYYVPDSEVNSCKAITNIIRNGEVITDDWFGICESRIVWN